MKKTTAIRKLKALIQRWFSYPMQKTVRQGSMSKSLSFVEVMRGNVKGYGVVAD